MAESITNFNSVKKHLFGLLTACPKKYLPGLGVKKKRRGIRFFFYEHGLDSKKPLIFKANQFFINLLSWR